MTHNLFVFSKSFKDRLDDYNYIFNKSLKAADVKKEWSVICELSLEPVGWRAIWKISHDLCNDLKILFPCTVVVIVQQIHFRELSCTVSISEVEDRSVCLPPMMTDVPLVELYPTIEQDNNLVLSRLFETAKMIDSLRFFYNNLWMPWDTEDDDESSWVDSHLEGRLKLHFALLERQAPSEVGYAVRKLVTEARKIQKDIEDTQDQLTEEMETDRFPSRMLELVKLDNRMSALKNQYKIYEKPVLLEAFIQSIKKNQLEYENCESVTFLVLNKCTPEQLKRLAKMTSESKLLRIFETLQETLIKVPANSTVCVLPGKYPVHDLGNLEVGGTIRGMEPGVVLTEEAESPSGWSLLSGTMTLSNLTVQMTSVWNIIKVRPGAECTLQDVKLEGASITDAIDVFPGTKLVANNCHFSNCRTAVVCDINSTVALTNCTFTNNNIAVEVKEGCCFTMENCTISDSKSFGIIVIVAAHGNRDFIDDVNSIPGLKESGTAYKNNAIDRHFDFTASKPGDNLNTSGETLSASR